jgi:hypothetical protein
MGAVLGKNWRKSAAYMRVNEHFESIFNTAMCQLKGFKTASLNINPEVTA